MLDHSSLWRAIDRLAADYDLSTSGLAKRSGLDPTTFNKSKRITPAGKLRWPSTESIAKILDATGASMTEFLDLMAGGTRANAPAAPAAIPVIGYAEAGSAGFFDDAGYPTGSGWDEVAFPHIEDPNAYALEVSGDSMEPAYRDGDVIIVSPAASVRRGDRVVVRTHDGEVMAKVLARQTMNRVELRSLNPDHEDRQFPRDAIDWLARIVWASQ